MLESGKIKIRIKISLYDIMSDKNDDVLDTMLYLILLVKIIWIVSIFSHFITNKYFHSANDEIFITVKEWTHNIFTLLIGFMLIYLYNHLTDYKVCISGHAKRYLYSFGIIACVGVIQKTLHEYYFDETIETMYHGVAYT